MMIITRFVIGMGIILVLVGIYQVVKPLPDGVNMTGTIYSVPSESVTFYADRTYVDKKGERHSEQGIFDEVIAMIKRAQQYILIDMFLFNAYQGDPPEKTRALADELTQALITKKQEHPGITITVVSDPLNTVYGGERSPQFSELKEHNIPVILTDLTKLRDSNPLYSVFWRLFIQWFGNNDEGSITPHPFQAAGRGVTIRSWLSLVNFKANHRKLVVADEPQKDGSRKMAVLVTSANPHDGSSAHSNVAVKVNDGIWKDAIVSEKAVGVFSDHTMLSFGEEVNDASGEVKVQLLTEGAIRKKIVELIDATQEKDRVDMAMFYVSDRSVVKGLVRASERGVEIRLLLDPNKDAFGHIKNGVPNRPVAKELISKSDGNISIRWCDTHGEQCHTKSLLIQSHDTFTMILGSANLTRRNIRNYNLETNILVSANEMIPAIQRAYDYFGDAWSNRDGKLFSTEYKTYEDSTWYKTVMYRVQEATGISSF